MKTLSFPYKKEDIQDIHAGDTVLITGTIYTARDAAHARLTEMIKKGEDLPFEITGSIIYYAGPTPAKPGHVIGSAGPTTSYRMDAYAPRLLDMGLLGMIGKGERSPEVNEAVKRNGAIYFAATGGAGALMAKCIESAEIIAFKDLGPEAVRKLTVRDFPVTAVTDSSGNDLYVTGRKNYIDSLTQEKY